VCVCWEGGGGEVCQHSEDAMNRTSFRNIVWGARVKCNRVLGAMYRVSVLCSPTA